MLPSALANQYLDACTGENRPYVPVAESAVYIPKLEDKHHHPYGGNPKQVFEL